MTAREDPNQHRASSRFTIEGLTDLGRTAIIEPEPVFWKDWDA